mmetsp:Transcript_9945/g.18938  ORF Transcript_9945/g.18938 Transcript_9945/m.18938 type:complete len:229 (-) Transcript_9945:140-826(-)
MILRPELLQSFAEHVRDVFGVVRLGAVGRQAPRLVQDSEAEIVILVHNHPVLRIWQARHGNVHFLPRDRRPDRLPDEKSTAVLRPIHLMRHVESIRNVVHPQRLVGPIGHRIFVPTAKTMSVRVFALGVGRLVNEPHGPQVQQLLGGRVRVQFDVSALLQYVLDDVPVLLVDEGADDSGHGDAAFAAVAALPPLSYDGPSEDDVDGGIHPYQLDGVSVADVEFDCALP